MKRTTEMGPIVVPLDGSPLAEVALAMGRVLAERTGAELHLVHVMTPPEAGPFRPDEQVTFEELVRSRSQAYLDRQAAPRPGERGGPPVRTSLLGHGSGVADAIAEYAREKRASWIVLATHGAGGLSRWVLGSVADGLARSAPAPLLLLRPWDATGDTAHGERPIQRVLVPLDGSQEAKAALHPATALAQIFGASLDLVRVVPPRPVSAELHGISFRVGSAEIDDEAAAYLDGEVQPLRAAGLAADAWKVAHDDVADGILTAAVERGSDVIVMSTHGRSGIARAVVGSVADRVINKGATALALVRPGFAGYETSA